VGPAEWVAEPAAGWWRTWLLVIMAALGAAAVTGQVARIRNRRRAEAAIVVVTGVPIRRDRLMQDLERRYGLQTVGRMVSSELQKQFAQRRKCWPTEAQVARRLEEEKRLPGFTDSLIRSQLNEEDYKDLLRFRLAEINMVIEGVDASEADARYFYERHTSARNPDARFRTPERIQVAVIRTATKSRAQQAMAVLLDGARWTEAVRRFSDHPDRVAGGLMMPFTRRDSPFAGTAAAQSVVFGMREGDRIGPLPASGHWWIVRCIHRWPAKTTPWDAAREDALMGARIEKGASRNARAIAEARARFIRESAIQVFDPAYDAVARPLVSRDQSR